MKRLLWPGILFVLMGSLVLLHAATLALAAGGPRLAGDRGGAARPRAGWMVDLGAEPQGDGTTRIVLVLGDAGARPIADAAVTLRIAKIDVALAHTGLGRYETALAGIGPVAAPCRVQVSRNGCTWSFDRSLTRRGGPEPGP
jgi:hypothetical protein